MVKNNTIIKGYPTTLRIYQIDDSPYWYTRLYVNGRMVKRSTKMLKKVDAVEFAKQFFLQQIQTNSGKSKNHQLTFVEIAEEVIRQDELKVERGDRNEKLNRDQRHTLKKDIAPFFGTTEVSAVNYPLLLKYVNRLNERKLASASILRYLAFVKKVMKHAARIGAIEHMPEFPTVEHKDSPRGWLQFAEYKKLMRYSEKLAKQGFEVRGKPITHEMTLLIRFMVNTFLRPSDMKQLKHRHVEIVRGANNYLRITTDFSKTVLHPIISMPTGIGAYEDIKAFQKERGYGKTDDYLFMPQYQNRNFALEILRRQFDEVLKAANLKTSASGADRTLYSLRHTAIMFRLTMGDVDLLTLSRNARTSVEMIDRFYAKHLTAEMNVEKLQSMRVSNKPTKTTTKKKTPSKKAS
jgi:hypothetical protein